MNWAPDTETVTSDDVVDVTVVFGGETADLLDETTAAFDEDLAGAPPLQVPNADWHPALQYDSPWPQKPHSEQQKPAPQVKPELPPHEPSELWPLSRMEGVSSRPRAWMCSWTLWCA